MKLHKEFLMNTEQVYRKKLSDKFKTNLMDFKQSLNGGLADDVVNISEFDYDQLEKGIKIELEHTNDIQKALEIALDHLREFPDYYDRLDKMETEAEQYFNSKKS